MIRWITSAVGYSKTVEAESESDCSRQFGRDVFGCAFLPFRDVVMQARYVLTSGFPTSDTIPAITLILRQIWGRRHSETRRKDCRLFDPPILVWGFFPAYNIGLSV